MTDHYAHAERLLGEADRCPDDEKQLRMAAAQACALLALVDAVRPGTLADKDRQLTEDGRLLAQMRAERDEAIASAASAALEDPCTAIYERSDDEVDDLYCCLRHGHDGDHVNEDGRSWPDTADRDGGDAGQEFRFGDRVWTVTGSKPGTIIERTANGHLNLRFDTGGTWWHTRDDLRHVYDAAHEPPEGVNVVRDMGEKDCLDDEEEFLCRTLDGGWDWALSPDHNQEKARGRHWRPVVDDADGPLVEHRPGDAA